MARWGWDKLSTRPEWWNGCNGPHSTTAGAAPNPGRPMLRVLIVDDHEIVRRGLKEVLADEFPELKVGEAGNSQGALELVTTQDWDVVLLDIHIPRPSGL